jgi:hypothetical protein
VGDGDGEEGRDRAELIHLHKISKRNDAGQLEFSLQMQTGSFRRAVQKTAFRRTAGSAQKQTIPEATLAKEISIYQLFK